MPCVSKAEHDFVKSVEPSIGTSEQMRSEHTRNNITKHIVYGVINESRSGGNGIESRLSISSRDKRQQDNY